MEFWEGALENMVGCDPVPEPPRETPPQPKDQRWILTSDSVVRLSIVRFVVAGIFSTLLYFILANAIVAVFAPKAAIASIVAYLVALIFSYVAQSRFTFQISQDSTDQIARFIITSIAGIAVSYGAMWVTIELLKWSFFTGAIIVCIVIPIANFFAFRMWVFVGKVTPATSGNVEGQGSGE